MDQKQYHDFLDDLMPVLEKHGVTHAAICGTCGDQFVGGAVTTDEKFNFTVAMETALNCGRLWQYSREMVRQILNQFERRT
jgi:hypothetical protein